MVEHEDAAPNELEPPSVKVRLPPPLLRAVDEAARRGGTNRSATVRELLVCALMARDLWPPNEVGKSL